MKIPASEAVKLLRAGKVVAVPTETVYGLAADALNPSAISKIFEVKNRPADNPLICHFHDVDQVKNFVLEIPESSVILIKHFSPGPISYMLNLPENSPLKFATCGNAQVIARIPDHPIFLDIIRGLDHPVAAPSANTSGKISPTSAEMVEEDLGDKIEGVVDGGISSIGIESTIVDARSENEIFILRPGAIGEAEIQKIIPKAKIISIQKDSFRENTSKPTPGAKYRHYAPETLVIEIEKLDSVLNENNSVLLLTQEQSEKISTELKERFKRQKIWLQVLGSTNDLNNLARSFYQNLASLDRLRVAKAFLLKNDWGISSLGKALQNRIEKIIIRL